MASDIEMIQKMLQESESAKDGLTVAEREACEAQMGFELPHDIRRLLEVSNGSSPMGQIFDSVRIAGKVDRMPGWKSARWVPIVSDGCGGTYTSIPVGDRRVLVFIDTSDYRNPAYMVSSRVLRGVVCLFEEDLGLRPNDWLFSQDSVLEEDPGLLAVALEYGIPLPWED